MKFFLIKKFFSSGQFWAPYEDGNQRNCSQKKRWKWCLMMLHKKQCLFEIKLFFCENLSYKDFLCQRKFHHGNRQKKVVFEKAFRILKGKNTSFGSVGNWLKIALALPLSAIFIPKTSSKKTCLSVNEIFFWFNKQLEKFYLFFELTKILEIDAKLLEEQNVEARNKMGKNNLYSWLF